MQIGHIITHYKPMLGGAEVYISNLIKILQAYGHSPQRVYQEASKANSPELRQVPKWLKKVLGSFSRALILKYYSSLKSEDLLIVHNMAIYMPLFMHKCIYVCHGVFWENPYQPYSLNKSIKIRARRVFEEAPKVVANNSHLFRDMGINLTPGERLFQEIIPGRWFIPNCVDLEAFQPNPGLESLKQLNPILVPRRVSKERGVELAIKAFAIFAEQQPQTNLVIAGYIHAGDYFDYLQKLIQELRLAGKVYFLGQVNHNFMPLIYSSALMTVIPTITSEGTSLSALESMACKTATISTNVGGLADLPTYKSEPAPEALAAAMIEALPKISAIAEQQRKEVESNFGLQRWRESWLKVVEGKL